MRILKHQPKTELEIYLQSLEEITLFMHFYRPEIWLDTLKPKFFNGLFDLSEDFDFHIISLNLFKLKEEAIEKRVKISVLLNDLIINELPNFYPQDRFDLVPTTEKRMDYCQMNVQLPISTWSIFTKRAKELGLGRNALLTYFLSYRYESK